MFKKYAYAFIFKLKNFYSPLSWMHFSGIGGVQLCEVLLYQCDPISRFDYNHEHNKIKIKYMQ